ncbi:enoyl-CoA hydratase/isomerase family protein [Sphingomonadaceae bacterium jetA1]|uniref:enoyl-CoA hydratase/isomerase family protein n=1 Tax=Facivitalis istanbulensis TaxID=3075838 RepID=UPI00347E0DB8
MTQDLIVTREGPVGRLRLNRPKAIHALTRDMCEGVLAALEDWRADLSVEAILIDHAEGRGFCAGGDIRLLAESGAGDGEAARAFFRAEYRMNHRLFTYAKPIVAVMDGITMGGGVGIAAPARYRIATENTRLAMPETGIGLFPDVGGGWYLSRLPGRMGVFLALTGHRLDGAEARALDLATHYLPASALGEAKAAILAAPQEIAATLDGLATPAPEAAIMAHAADIDRLFAADTLEEILAALEADGGEWAARQRGVLRAKSPQACKVSLRLLREGALTTDFADEMAREYGVAAHVVQRPDFIEGVRALIVEKDNAPRWNPATPDGVTDTMIDHIFAALPEGQAWTPDDR